jgi:hypothetical protein
MHRQPMLTPSPDDVYKLPLVVVAVIQSSLSLLIALGVLRLIQYALLSRDSTSAMGQGLTFFIGTV